MYTIPCTECELSVTLLSVSTLLLFATLAGVCHHENTRHRLLLSVKVLEPVGSQDLETQERDLAISDSAGLRKSSSLFEVLGHYFLASYRCCSLLKTNG